MRALSPSFLAFLGPGYAKVINHSCQTPGSSRLCGIPELKSDRLLEACARITERWPDVAVLMLSMYANEEYVLRALRNGALGYLLKSASASELELAIRAAVKGDRYLSPEVSKHVIDAYVNRTDRKSVV